MLVPKPHQADAVAANIQAFSTDNRVKNIMACGTGKSLIALKTYRQLKQVETISSVVVFIPTILLIQQFCEGFIAEFGIDSHDIQLVCWQDGQMFDDINADEVSQQFNLGVLRKSADARKFLSQTGEKTKVLFCTYASAKLLQGCCFDLGIFDEAHKTTGEIDKPFGFALHDTNIKIIKRLFLTATEKVEIYNKENRIGMNNANFYGKTSYSLPFREAINQGLITDYKLIVTVVSRGDIAHLINDRTKDIYEIANLYALQKAKEKFGIRKVITFHKTVDRAKKFEALAKTINTGFEAFHVNGEQGSNTRKRIFKQFQQSTDSYITNARCLTEGVDVPDVDAVAFFDPRGGEVDIVQAIGRTVRLSKDKQLGYILLPIYLWDIEEALSKELISKDSAFKNIIDIVSILNEEDEDFRTKLSQSNLKLKKDKLTALDMPFEFMGDLPDHISSDYLYRSITVEVISNYDQHFLSMIDRLDQYVLQHGHGYVPKGYEDNQLALWANAQRSNIRYGSIAKHREKLLIEHGFIQSIFEYEWEQGFTAYKNARQNVAADEDIADPNIKQWIINQRSHYREGKLKDARLARLKEIGFEYVSMHDIWLNGYNLAIKELESLKSLSCFTKKNSSYEWLRTQRRRWHVLGEEKRTLLEKIGWDEYIKNLGKRKKKA